MGIEGEPTDLKVADINAAKVPNRVLVDRFAREVAASKALGPIDADALANFARLDFLVSDIRRDFRSDPNVIVRGYPIEEEDEDGKKVTRYLPVSPDNFEQVTVALAFFAYGIYSEIISANDLARTAAQEIHTYIEGILR